MNEIASESNRLKQLAGAELKDFLKQKFTSLVDDKIILRFKVNQNFCHHGFSYKKQYLANFIIETLDNKFIIINSSNSYRHDRMKIQSYDVEGIANNASISDQIIASILLYPDDELNNESLISFRKKVDEKQAHSPATHILVVSELVDFLENHKAFIEEEKVREAEEEKNGSYYGLRGNAFEKEVVAELNKLAHLEQIKNNGDSGSLIFNQIVSKICSDYDIPINTLIKVDATNTVLKLKSGGNAKTDVILTLKTPTQEVTETISIKNTTQSRVSCHDYKCDDFIRVMNIEGSKLANYLTLYQKCGSHKAFVEGFPDNYNLVDFEQLLEPKKDVLLEWALTGKHDIHNLINPKSQVSNYLLMNKSGEIKFIDFHSYIVELYDKSKKLVYGLPLSWTYPSKQRGARIQLKLPILV